MGWIDALPLAELEAKGRAVVRQDGRQILVMRCGEAIYACPNRCPHEGYPLSEGVLFDGCVLTCTWHNWKFDLASGETLVGGDLLVRYPVRVESGRVLIDMTPLDPAARRTRILANIETALDAADEERLVRETARLVRLGADPLDAVRAAIAWAGERLRFGTTHAIAGAPDWLRLHDGAAAGSEERLVAIGEILGHLADDARANHGRFPFPDGLAAWDKAGFLAAVEDEDEAAAQRMLRGALRAGLSVDDLMPVLAEAALAHYADFGHSLIYTVQSSALIRRLGPESAETVLNLLVRALIYATREDLLPEFRDYPSLLADWGIGSGIPLDPATLRRLSPRSAMKTVASWSVEYSPDQIFAALVGESAWILLHVDGARLSDADAKLADSIGWLDFTHALTFAEAGRTVAASRPDLWPAILLQLACFIGRNAGYVDADYDARRHDVADIDEFLAASETALFDHGRDRFIVSVHLLKTLSAGKALISALPAQASTIAAALRRLLSAPMKGRHTLRTARQMRDLVEQEI